MTWRVGGERKSVWREVGSSDWGALAVECERPSFQNPVEFRQGHTGKDWGWRWVSGERKREGWRACNREGEWRCGQGSGVGSGGGGGGNGKSVGSEM